MDQATFKAELRDGGHAEVVDHRMGANVVNPEYAAGR
jgi:hypothetical protein